MKLKPDEKIHQYVIRLKNCADDCIDCDVSGKVVFEPLSNTFLSNFAPYMSLQAEIAAAINLRDFDGVAESVSHPLKGNPSLLNNPA